MTDPANLFPFLLFSVLMTVTPGPNNTMALAAGVRVGVVRSLPLVGGIAGGVALQMIAVGLGFGALFETYPTSHDLLRILGAVYLLWLAWKIGRSAPMDGNGHGPPPLGFFGAALFQWINPKAWAITAGAAATYLPRDTYFTNVGLAALLLGLVAVPCVGLWVVAGRLMRGILAHPSRARAFNVVVAVLLVASTLPMFAEIGTR